MRKRDRIAKEWGQAHGYYGKVGGWIYHERRSSSLMQGWAAFGGWLKSRGVLVKSEDGEWVVNDNAPLKNFEHNRTEV